MDGFRVASFSTDVTPPSGHPLCGGWITPVTQVADPLWAHGLVLLGAGQPIVLCAVDWCEIRNEAFAAWREGLAQAAGTTPERVLVATVHQHDAPLADLGAQRLLILAHGSAVCDSAFCHAAIARTAKALKAALAEARPVNLLGTGQAKVHEVASTRRLLGADGKVARVRYTAERDPEARAAPEGLIDPYLKTLSFWQDEQPVAALSVYATHPMSHYGHGEVSSDFCGLARERRRAELPGVAQLYFNGCAGDLGAGKYNDGQPSNRAVLSQRIHEAMLAAWEATVTVPLERLDFRVERLLLPAKCDPGFRRADYEQALAEQSGKHVSRARAALGIAWLERAANGIDLPCLDLGVARVVLLPGEPFIAYQLAAQQLAPDSMVLVLGYGDCGPGYIPLAENYPQGGYEPGDWCFVTADSEAALRAALAAALGGN
ncbi:MAG: hypothetical protein HUU35_04350 [Armatimonadetes bacterium]|nr:hypothetical protein [Armatimonadota bacterium]